MKILKSAYLWILGAGLIIMGLAGCGGNGEDATGTASNSTIANATAQRGPIDNGGGRSIDPRTSQNAAAP